MTYAARTSPRHSGAQTTDDLVHGHLALVRRLAWHVHGKTGGAAELEELVQTGMVALVEAAHHFEDLGFAFSTYASVRVKGAMIDHLRRSSGRSRTSAGARRELAAARHAVETAMPGPASPADIARHMQLSPDAYFRLESDAHSGAAQSLEECYAEDSLDFSDSTEPAEDLLDRTSREERLREALQSLDARSQMVLKLYFFEEFNLEEIGRTLDIGAARVCQIKKAALARLKSMDLIPDFMG